METKIKHKVVLVDTKDNTLIKVNLSNKLLFNNNEATACPNQHMYILSEEEFKEGDFILHLPTGRVIENYNLERRTDKNLYKIVASTNRIVIKETPRRSADDFDLEVYYNKEYIPNIHPLFIEEFVGQWNEGNVIEYVNVDCSYNITNEDWSKRPVQLDGYYKPKVDHANCIFTSPVKESWDRREVALLIHKYRIEKGLRDDVNSDDCNEWINQNI